MQCSTGRADRNTLGGERVEEPTHRYGPSIRVHAPGVRFLLAAFVPAERRMAAEAALIGRAAPADVAEADLQEEQEALAGFRALPAAALTNGDGRRPEATERLSLKVLENAY